ncbi:hypothetical protein A9179_00305 [Pseudomonas alcaligenes]|uniref:Outer membrane protein beta-barrel domain-containing protein n=1 Tax=Aquipseudomonas alcaligenes TaxID=43263 RepID=A0ABR7RUA2_AQUAC|nr:outer membrane beta-barrel protein [Pseudomonas alcaligenes]MBC9248705.1 hypothetical protein [Pseudomonas alcaligenes]
MKRIVLLASLLAPLPVLAAGFEGAYAGLYTGYAWAQDEGTSYNQPTDTKSGWTQETNPSGAQYGALGGYNWLLQNNWLVGVEADYEGRIDGEDSAYQEFHGVTDTGYSTSSEITAAGSLRARFGYLPSADLLLFATAGYAYAQVDREWNDKQFLNRSESHSDGQGG